MLVNSRDRQVDVLEEVRLPPIKNIKIPYLNMFHLPCINQCQKYTIHEQMYFNIYNVFYPHYSPHHVSEQELRSVKNEILLAMA